MRRKNEFAMNLDPTLGLVELFIDEQVYRLIGHEPCERKDGEPSLLLRWETNCPDCAARFSVTTGRRLSFQRVVRRCKPCRKPLVRVRRRASNSNHPMPEEIADAS